MSKPMNKDLQQKIALGVILYIIAMVMFNNMVISGINKKTKEVKDRVQLQKLIHAEGLVKVANMKNIKEKHQEKNVEYREKSSAFITEKEKKTVLKEIEEAGKKHGVKIETISLMKSEPAITSKLNGEAAVDKAGREIDMTQYKEYRITMTLKSGYSELTEYIKEIEGLEKLVLVQEMDLKSDGREISARVLLKCYLVESGGV